MLEFEIEKGDYIMSRKRKTYSAKFKSEKIISINEAIS